MLRLVCEPNFIGVSPQQYTNAAYLSFRWSKKSASWKIWQYAAWAVYNGPRSAAGRYVMLGHTIILHLSAPT
jgi:hypothetical protein